MTVDWQKVGEQLRSYTRDTREDKLDGGQRASHLQALATRIDEGLRLTLLADEVGMGKTRIAPRCANAAVEPRS